MLQRAISIFYIRYARVRFLSVLFIFSLLLAVMDRLPRPKIKGIIRRRGRYRIHGERGMCSWAGGEIEWKECRLLGMLFAPT